MGNKSLVRRHHPVLAVVSHCYSEPKGRFPRVTHPCATSSEELVRLACVRHAASVRSEPGSNSQVMSQHHAARTKSQTTQHRTSGADTCTVKRNGYEGHAWHRLALNYVIEPEAPKTQAPSPTCPFIKINNVKEHTNTNPDNNPPPRKPQGDKLSAIPVGDLATSPARGLRSVGGGRLGGHSDSVNTLFSHRRLFQGNLCAPGCGGRI